MTRSMPQLPLVLPREEKMEEYEVSSVVEEQLECLREAGNDKKALVAPFSAAYLPICALCSGLLTSSCFTSGFMLSLADRISFGDRVVEALTVTSGSLKLSPLSFFCKILEYRHL